MRKVSRALLFIYQLSFLLLIANLIQCQLCNILAKLPFQQCNINHTIAYIPPTSRVQHSITFTNTFATFVTSTHIPSINHYSSWQLSAPSEYSNPSYLCISNETTIEEISYVTSPSVVIKLTHIGIVLFSTLCQIPHIKICVNNFFKIFIENFYTLYNTFYIDSARISGFRSLCKIYCI